MLHYQDQRIKDLLFKGAIGLEKESLRVTGDGFMAQTPHPFPQDDPHIVRDFCENQTEINTDPMPGAREAYDQLLYETQRINRTLSELDEREYLWPFSNPPYILDEENIPIAKFYGEEAKKTEYREYLAVRYGRYKMTFSGIHFNYSFSDELLRQDYDIACQAAGKEPGAADPEGYRRYKDDFYVSLAAMVQQYNWLVVAATAASPLLDSSYFEKGRCGHDVYNGMASSRCSEIGYWNFFTPLLDYRNIEAYTESIENIVKSELIRSASELYFPVRVKPAGSYSQEKLLRDGADHIELRMIDLNPLDEAGIDLRDVKFLQMLLVFLACIGRECIDANAQIKAIGNTKNAARFDLKTVNLVDDQGKPENIAHGAVRVLDAMDDFYRELDHPEAAVILAFERAKFTEIKNRYAWQVRERFSGGFVKKGMEYVKGDRQDAGQDIRKLLYDRYIAPTKKKRDEFVGVEIEMPIVNLAKEAVDFANVHEVTKRFMHEFSFLPVKHDEEGEVCLAEHEDKGDTLSFDCSYNNLELSFGKEKDIREVERRFGIYYDFLQECFADYGYTLTGMGINPYRVYNQNIPVPNGRYRMLFHHLHSYDRYRTLPMYFHSHPEFGTFSSASQVQLDVFYDEIPEVINTFSLLEPFKALIFANSPLLGEAPDYLCYRDILWENSTHGINPHNVGPYECVFESTDELLDYIQSTSIYCAERDDKYINFAPIPLREFFAKEEVEGEYYRDGRYHKIIIRPEESDLKYLRSFKHEDLTYRGTVEFRSVCCQPIKDAMTVAAFHAGLKRKLSDLTAMSKEDRVIYGHGYNATELRHLFIKKDLPSFVDREQVYGLSEKILELARRGLEERGFGEEGLLDPLFERVKNRENPAQYMLRRMAEGASEEDIIKEFSKRC